MAGDPVPDIDEGRVETATVPESLPCGHDLMGRGLSGGERLISIEPGEPIRF